MRRLLVASLICLGSLQAALAGAQAYPNRPIRVIVPYPAGGATDIVARLTAQKLQQALTQPVVIENRSGGVTMIGAEAAARAQPDGYTLLMSTSIPLINTLVFKKAPYKVSDFAPVAGVARTPNVLVVNPAVPARTLNELIAYGKANPGKLNNVILGPGSLTHLLAERFSLATGVPLFHVAYRGAAPALQDLLANQVQVFFDAIATSAPLIKSGKLRALAITSDERSSAAPEVPTFKELGYPSMASTTWYGFLAPAGTPQAIIDRLNTEIDAAVATPELRNKLIEIGATPLSGNAEDFAAYIKHDLAFWAEVVRATKVEVD